MTCDHNLLRFDERSLKDKLLVVEGGLMTGFLNSLVVGDIRVFEPELDISRAHFYGEAGRNTFGSGD